MGVEAASPSSTPDRQVLVVGSGVDGLTTAAFLDQRGLSPVVIPSPHEPASTRPAVLWPSTLTLLSDLGITTPLVNAGTSIRRWTLQCVGDTAAESLTSASGTSWPFVAVDRHRFRERLETQLPSGCVRLSKRPRAARPTDRGVQVAFEDGVREQFDVVVGADGPQSWLRRELFDETSVPWGTATWTLATDATDALPETAREAYTDVGVLSCVPNSNPRTLRLVTATGTDPDLDTVRQQLRDLGVLSDESATGPLDSAVVDRRTDHVVGAEHWSSGHTALVGRTARSLPPGVCVGPSLAVEDAYVLAAELAGATVTSAASALAAYAQRRRERHRVLGQHVPIDDRFPSAHRNPVVGCWSFRRSFLHSLFAVSVPSVSAGVTRHL